MKIRYAPRTDATAEELAQALFALPQDHHWHYKQNEETEYRCVVCGEAVHHPATLHSDGRCSDCQKKANE